MPRFLPALGARVLFPRTLPGVLALSIAAASCGASTPVAAPGDSTVQSETTSSSPSTSDPDIVVVASPEEPATTSSSTTSTTVEVLTSSFDVVDDIDRGVLASDVIVADTAGRFLATVLDPQGLGCEGSAPAYYVVVGAENEISEVQLPEAERTYAGDPTISPNRHQVLDVGLCEGSLGDVLLYDLGTDLNVSSLTAIDTGGSVSGHATWTSDGFIAMFLQSASPLINEPTADGAASDGEAADGAVAGEQPGTTGPSEPPVAEYLVNPRTGQRTQSGSLDRLHFGAVRLPDGRLVYTAFNAEVSVVVADRGGTPMNSYSASIFAVSPDANWMLVSDWIFDSSEEISIELVNLVTGEAEVLAAGSSLQAKWAPNSERVAFANGLETYVYDLPSGDMITVGAAEPVGCESDSFVVWGRVPMAFAPSGDLYVGDAVCGESDDGFPFEHYQIHQIILG